MEQPEGADEFVVEGYGLCRCGQWLVEVIPGSTMGLCADCRAQVGTAAHEEQFVYEAHGRRFTQQPRAPRKPKQRRAKHQTSEQRAARQGRDRARIRALVRLQRIYRPMYEVLYAEECVREGVQASPNRGRPRPKAISAELLRDVSDAADRDAARAERIAERA